MSDYLIDLGENPQVRRLMKTLGLPIPLPQKLRRAPRDVPWEQRPLADRQVVVGAAPGAQLLATIADTLAAVGADPWLDAAVDDAPFREPGQAFGRPARRADGEAIAQPDALVFDASGIASAPSLRALYDFFHARLAGLARCGRVVVLGRSTDGAAPERAVAQAALDGFARSIAREIGRMGATANLVLVDEGAEARVAPLLRWLLSARSTFVTAQPFRVTARVRLSSNDIPLVRPLEGKVALVTGAARGIGAATARRLAAEGAHVVCLDRPADDGPNAQIAREIGGSTLSLDVSDAGAARAIAEALRARHGGVDIVVHNAGVTRDKTIARMSPEHWDQVLAINLDAILRVTEALLGDDGARLLRDDGRVVCLSSIGGIAGNVGQTNYAASKAGVIGYVRALATRLEGRGVAVNAVAPGFIETRLSAAMPMAVREIARRLSALAQGGLPEDVAELITFLASPGAAALSGAVVRVCGGSVVGA